MWTRYSYDGLEVLRDVSSDGSTVEYVNGGELDDHLWQRTSSGTTQYFLTDHQGSTRALADGSGAVVASYSYDTFGNGFSGSQTRFGYTGREHDSETGLLYYRARWYDPGQGRFVSEDPLGFGGGNNWYGYVGNDPANWIDPVGLFDRGKWKPPVSTKPRIGRKLGVGLGLGLALGLAWEIWDSVNQSGPKPLPLPQATPTPTPTPMPQAAAGASGAGASSGGGGCLPPKTQFIDLVRTDRRIHILYGDPGGSGGGHKFGFGAAKGKDEFPASWSDDEIIHHISDIATDPSLSWVQQSGKAGARFTKSGLPVRYKIEGETCGIKIRVIVEPDGMGIVTGFPYQ